MVTLIAGFLERSQPVVNPETPALRHGVSFQSDLLFDDKADNCQLRDGDVKMLDIPDDYYETACHQRSMYKERPLQIRNAPINRILRKDRCYIYGTEVNSLGNFTSLSAGSLEIECIRAEH
jgi:hypothetical protein